jgi:hypothetical protein
MTYRERDQPASCTGMGIRFTGFEPLSSPEYETRPDWLH